MSLEPQAALESAVRDAIRAQLGYTNAQSERTYDGQPPARAGTVFVAVWYDGQRGSQSRTCLDELFGVYVTVTVRFTQPFDRWLAHRDDLETRVNAIIGLVHKDSWDFSVTNAASTLAGFRNAGTPTIALPVGWCEALMFAGADPIQTVGPDWFQAEVDAPGPNVGCAQRLRFAKSRRIQAMTSL